MVIETTPTFPVLTVQSPLLTVSRQQEDPMEVLRRAGTAAYAAVFWETQEALPALTVLAERLGPRLLLSERWQQDLPQCGVLISSSLSGGTAEQRFVEAAQAAHRRCWLLLEWMCMEFLLPCPSGMGTPLTKSALEARLEGHRSFFDPGLCCEYIHWLEDGHGRMVLYDTAETLTQKAILARQAGFQGVVVCDGAVSDGSSDQVS